jgi:methionine synthase I (cobalamin-dependent)
MVNNFRTLLNQKILVGDGAMGTMLQAAGLTTGHCPEEWNVTHSEVVEKLGYFVNRQHLLKLSDKIKQV